MQRELQERPADPSVEEKMEKHQYTCAPQKDVVAHSCELFPFFAQYRRIAVPRSSPIVAFWSSQPPLPFAICLSVTVPFVLAVLSGFASYATADLSAGGVRFTKGI